MSGHPWAARTLLVTGSRLLTADRHGPAIERGLIHAGKLLGRDTVLVHGACPPADRPVPWRPSREKEHTDGLDWIAAERWKRWGLLDDPHPANWGELGVKAGPVRNEEMVAAGADMAMIWPFPDPRVSSRGTWDFAQRCWDHGIATFSGWTCTPVLEIPGAHPEDGYRGPAPHAEALARAGR